MQNTLGELKVPVVKLISDLFGDLSAGCWCHLLTWQQWQGHERYANESNNSITRWAFATSFRRRWYFISFFFSNWSSFSFPICPPSPASRDYCGNYSVHFLLNPPITARARFLRNSSSKMNRNRMAFTFTSFRVKLQFSHWSSGPHI